METKPNSNSSNFTCFGCGKQGQIKMTCPNSKNKDNLVTRNEDLIK